eukprot:TRINITY_DN6909_c0_g1_i4.p3 TRINITY_DN6909_c0_g1~~TRINITY_DN6909_c0_g1_i4.p3  ORF type:complete len:115 (-),score=13.63 TRINITY_DN6909_c0_g1_i4:788-1132(-)
MIRRPPRSTLSSSSAASDVYKRQGINAEYGDVNQKHVQDRGARGFRVRERGVPRWMRVDLHQGAGGPELNTRQGDLEDPTSLHIRNMRSPQANQTWECLEFAFRGNHDHRLRQI